MVADPGAGTTRVLRGSFTFSLVRATRHTGFLPVMDSSHLTRKLVVAAHAGLAGSLVGATALRIGWAKQAGHRAAAGGDAPDHSQRAPGQKRLSRGPRRRTFHVGSATTWSGAAPSGFARRQRSRHPATAGSPSGTPAAPSADTGLVRKAVASSDDSVR
ncbi:hypothetical protein GCM10027187_48920 [Streptosporangium sandarakinum]